MSYPAHFTISVDVSPAVFTDSGNENATVFKACLPTVTICSIVKVYNENNRMFSTDFSSDNHFRFSDFGSVGGIGSLDIVRVG